MKGIFVVIDGMGDVSNKRLGNKTPLDVAETPNINFLATRGEMGVVYPVKPGFAPESDEAIISLFGNDLSFGLRGQLEAYGEGVTLKRGDLALRVNFATIDSSKDGNILDRRTGRTLSFREAEVLCNDLNKIKLSVPFELIQSINHQAILVLRGGFSDNIIGNDPTYVQGKTNAVTKTKQIRSLDEEDNTQYTVNVLNEFIQKAHDVLKKHPVNIERQRQGLMSANYLLLRGAGAETPKLKQYKNWMSFSYFPLEMGFSKLSGMELFTISYPELKGIDSYENIWSGLKKACKYAVKYIKKNHKKFDYAYVHINEVDLAGHDNKPIEKKLMLEYIDSTLFKFLRKFCPPRKINVLLTSNHATVCKLKEHSSEGVPLMFFNCGIPREKVFNETEAKKGILGRVLGKDLLKKVGFI